MPILREPESGLSTEDVNALLDARIATLEAADTAQDTVTATKADQSELDAEEAAREAADTAETSARIAADDLKADKTDLETWSNFINHWEVEPAQIATIASGAVWSYVLGGVTRYRLVPDPYVPTQDSFYAEFDGATLTNLIVSKSPALALGS